MSKISQKNKELKAKGKPAKTRAAKAAKKQEAAPPTKSAVAKALNYGRCCTCAFYGRPCHKTNDYTPRKAEKPCYKPGPRVQA